MKFTTEKGDAFATFTESARNVAAAIARRYIAATLQFQAGITCGDAANIADAGEDMANVHAFMASGARAETLDHTGGNVWVSHTLHDTLDGGMLLVSAGCDSLEVVRAMHAQDVRASADARWEDCGEDNGAVVLKLYAEDDGAATARDELCESALNAFDKTSREYHDGMAAKFPNIPNSYTPPDEDDCAMFGAADADLRAWCDDLRDRVGMNVDAFRAALETYITARHADLFVRALRDLGPVTLCDIVARNACEDIPEVCHAHDYCDANVVMAKACGQDETAPVTDSDVDDMMAAWAAAAPMLGKAVLS
jgi:hypothetical protein